MNHLYGQSVLAGKVTPRLLGWHTLCRHQCLLIKRVVDGRVHRHGLQKLHNPSGSLVQSPANLPARQMQK
jgi:hypothetical protein